MALLQAVAAAGADLLKIAKSCFKLADQIDAEAIEEAKRDIERAKSTLTSSTGYNADRFPPGMALSTLGRACDFQSVQLVKWEIQLARKTLIEAEETLKELSECLLIRSPHQQPEEQDAGTSDLLQLTTPRIAQPHERVQQILTSLTNLATRVSNIGDVLIFIFKPTKAGDLPGETTALL